MTIVVYCSHDLQLQQQMMCPHRWLSLLYQIQISFPQKPGGEQTSTTNQTYHQTTNYALLNSSKMALLPQPDYSRKKNQNQKETYCMHPEDRKLEEETPPKMMILDLLLLHSPRCLWLFFDNPDFYSSSPHTVVLFPGHLFQKQMILQAEGP
ncbi:hypothetical protein Dimus_025686 [Dionaea muscipula]